MITFFFPLEWGQLLVSFPSAPNQSNQPCLLPYAHLFPTITYIHFFFGLPRFLLFNLSPWLYRRYVPSFNMPEPSRSIFSLIFPATLVTPELPLVYSFLILFGLVTPHTHPSCLWNSHFQLLPFIDCPSLLSIRRCRPHASLVKLSILASHDTPVATRHIQFYQLHPPQFSNSFAQLALNTWMFPLCK